jgi:hypothetical protein
MREAVFAHPDVTRQLAERQLVPVALLDQAHGPLDRKTESSGQTSRCVIVAFGVPSVDAGREDPLNGRDEVDGAHGLLQISCARLNASAQTHSSHIVSMTTGGAGHGPELDQHVESVRSKPMVEHDQVDPITAHHVEGIGAGGRGPDVVRLAQDEREELCDDRVVVDRQDLPAHGERPAISAIRIGFRQGHGLCSHETSLPPTLEGLIRERGGSVGAT